MTVHVQSPEEVVLLGLLYMASACKIGLIYVLVPKNSVRAFIQLSTCENPEMEAGPNGIAEWIAILDIRLRAVKDRVPQLSALTVRPVTQDADTFHYPITFHCP